MANPLDNITRRDEDEEDLSRLPRIVIRPATLPEGGNGDVPDLIPTNNNLTRAVAPANQPIDLMAGLQQLRGYVDRFLKADSDFAADTAGTVEAGVRQVPRLAREFTDFDRRTTEGVVNAIKTLYTNPELARRVMEGFTGLSTQHTVPGRTGQPAQSPPVERFQTSIEKSIRSGLSLPGDVMSGKVPVQVVDPVTGEAVTNPEVVHRAMDTAGMMGGGALIERPGAAGTATLGSGPMLKVARQLPDGEIQIGKPGQIHSDLLSDAELYKGVDKTEGQMGYALPNGQFLTRNQALEFANRYEPERAMDANAKGRGLEAVNYNTLLSDTAVPGAAVAGAVRSASPFYSALEHALINTDQASAPGAQWLGTLKNSPGVKPEELAWTGVEDWLKAQKGKVSKEDVQRYLDEHKVEVKEVTKGKGPRTLDDLTAQQRRDLLDDYRETNGLPSNEVPHPRELERHLQAMDEEYGHPDAASSTRYSQWQLPGGDNYREHLLTLPPKPQRSLTAGDHEATIEAVRKDFERDWQGRELPSGRRAGTWEQEGEKFLDSREGRELYDKYWGAKEQEAAGGYNSSHWDEPNVLAHVRTNDRTFPGTEPDPRYVEIGNRIEKQGVNSITPEERALYNELDAHQGKKPIKSLHLEEIQSDWHQQGRKQGYDRKLKPEDVTVKKIESQVPEGADPSNYPGYWESYGPGGELISWHRGNATEAQARAEAVEADAATKRVPDAPFKTSWPELALKRMIRMAAEEGKDRISWTPGEAQAARYDLSKQVNLVSGMKQPDGKYLIYIEGKDGQPLMRRQNGWGDYGQKALTPEELEATIGKEPAKKIIEGKPNKEGWIDLRDNNLKVGGEGMKGFYDKMLPKMVEKLGKAHGVKVRKARLGGDAVYNQKTSKMDDVPGPDVYYFDIPPAWKDQALSKGFPLFMNGIPFPVIPVDHDPFKQGGQ